MSGINTALSCLPPTTVPFRHPELISSSSKAVGKNEVAAVLERVTKKSWKQI